jgi:hypothetical protein
MKRWLISYDLLKPGKDYQPLWDELKKLKAQRVLRSQWALRSSKSAIELRDYLKQYTDTTDRLLISPLDDWASYNTEVDINTI